LTVNNHICVMKPALIRCFRTVRMVYCSTGTYFCLYRKWSQSFPFLTGRSWARVPRTVFFNGRLKYYFDHILPIRTRR